ncbi:hypothetical protein K523DRAFT_398549 [Schizophyllum commune Tattone D]|nr:hypothetical protein K523DRAFT_398549 [Schizophyllum commune Tattone D]
MTIKIIASMSGFLTSYLDVGAEAVPHELQDIAFESNFELDFEATAQWDVNFDELAGQLFAVDSIAQIRPVSVTVTIVALDSGIPSSILASDTLPNILSHPQYGPRPDYITLGSLAMLREAGAHAHTQPLPILSVDMSIPDHRFLHDYLTIHHSSTSCHFLIILARELQVSAPRPTDRMANSHILPTLAPLDPLVDTSLPVLTIDPTAAQFSPMQDLVTSMRSCLAMDRILHHEADASGSGRRFLSTSETTTVLAQYSWTHSTFSAKMYPLLIGGYTSIGALFATYSATAAPSMRQFLPTLPPPAIPRPGLLRPIGCQRISSEV